MLRCDVRSSRFEYDDEYLARPDSTPISLSMPLRPGTFPPDIVDPFLWGLLPDSSDTLQRWALLASPPADEHNPFTLLEHYGRDCAGAIQFIRPEEFDSAGESGPTQWLTDSDIGHQLRALRRDPNAWTFDDTGGRFSLAGAQAKFALLHDGDRWGRPQGATPTTHIVKPGIPEFRSSALNEHICLNLASAVGLPSARSSIREFDGEAAIVVERYDRIAGEKSIARIHQEDFCQALGVMPSQKYQDDGGPGLSRMAGAMRASQRSDQATRSITRVLLATAFNWLIGGTDAHAKNYSVLLRRGQVSLAPLYDIASITPYPRYDPLRVRLAQSVDGHYRMGEIGPREWQAQAIRLGLDPEYVTEEIRRLTDLVADRIDLVCSDEAAAAIDSEFLRELRRSLAERVERLRGRGSRG
ncbi:type II toxin-antitoxin system HipA family toxin [Herbiconiux moechotypicola]|uniref:Type II toxin-antitoxin system HipA family toxin n=2 Tax=Herbiconiux moechotypicola TaxID=637393 RepID=A0ABN3DSL2_9MICO